MNNTVKVIIKVATALAAVAGVVYAIAAYGDKIVAWAKKLIGRGDCECIDCFEDCEECECECECDAEDAPVEEVEETIEATEADFEG